MEAQVKEPGFTQERLNDVLSKKLSLGDLNTTEREQLDEYSRTGKIESQEEEVTTPVDSPKAAVDPVELSPDEITLKAVKKKLFDSQVKLNTQNQLMEQQATKAEFVAKQLEELKSSSKITERTNDNFDDATQANNVDRISRLEDLLKASLEREQTAVTQERNETNTVRQSLEDERSELSIKKLQDANPELRTSVSISQLDKELTRFMDVVGGIDNVNKYLEDPEFRKTKDAEGIEPLSEAFIQNKDKYGKVVELNHQFAVIKDANGLTYKDRNTDGSIELLYMNNKIASGEYSDQLRNANLTGANAVIDKVVSQKHTAPTMSPSSGADLPTEGMTPNQALDIMKRIKPLLRTGKILSVDDQASWEKYQDYVRTQGFG